MRPLNGTARHGADLGAHFEFVLELQRRLEVELRGYAWPRELRCRACRAEARAVRERRRENVQACEAPHGMLGFLHVAEEHREMDHARRIRFGELDAAGIRNR